MSFVDVTDRPAPGEFHRAPQAVRRRTLIAHLCDDFVFAGEFAQHARLMHRAGERLLAIDMLTAPDRGGCGCGVRVIGRGNNDGVNAFAHFIEHPAEVLERFRLRISFEIARRAVVIHIAQSDDVFPELGHGCNVAAPAPGNADGCDVESAVGFVGECSPAVRKDEQPHPADGCAAEETPA